MTLAPARGTCFGFAVASDLPLQYLRGGPAEARLRVEEAAGAPNGPPGRLLTSWRRDGDRPLEARLHADGTPDRFRLWVGGSGWFGIDAAAAVVTVPAGEEPVRREERLWGIPALLCLLRRGLLPLHAAAVEVGGTALLLAAPSGHGKTTLAAALVRAGARLLSEDLSPVRLGEQAAVLPGPAMLRLRHDIAAHVRLPAARTVATDADRVHVALDPATRGDCRPVPLAGVLLLREGDGAPRLERVPALRALPDLWALSYHPHTRRDHERCFAQITTLVERVPVWDLVRPLRLEVLDAVTALVAGEAVRG